MDVFVDWFIRTAPEGRTTAALTRAALGIWFSIHPFEDGNGASGALWRKVPRAEYRSAEPDRAGLRSNDRKGYYDSSKPTRDSGVTAWLLWFAGPIHGAAGYADTGCLLHRQGEVLRPVPRPAERPAGQGD